MTPAEMGIQAAQDDARLDPRTVRRLERERCSNYNPAEEGIRAARIDARNRRQQAN